MTHPYDGQPEQDAGQPQPAGYAYPVVPTQSYDQQPAGAYPEPGGYAYPAPLPPVQVVYGPAPRPGVVTAAAVLAYVQGGITGIAALVAFVSLFASQASTGTLLVDALVVLATATGAGLLIAGGVRLTGGAGRGPLVVACVLEFAICVYYVVVFVTVPVSVIDPANDLADVEGALGVARGMMVLVALFFAIMPTISLALACGRTTTAFLRSRRL